MATIRIQNIYFSVLKNFANSLPSASNFKSFSRPLEQFFLTGGKNNFGNKIPFVSKDFLNYILSEEKKSSNRR